MLESNGLPKNVLFDCSTDAFEIYDAEEAKKTLGYGLTQPWLSFETGPSNVIETTPKRVVSHKDNAVGVECEDGTVFIDFYDGTATKETADKKWRYMGGIDRRNDGLGYLLDS